MQSRALRDLIGRGRMHRLRANCWSSASAVALAAAFATSVSAETYHVPGDFPAIQACIEAVGEGDECLVAPGTYSETIDFMGKAIAVRSSDGADVTTIDAIGLKSRVVNCVSGEGPGTVLDGFTITGGRVSECPDSTFRSCGGGMANIDSSPTVTNCNFVGNAASDGGGMFNLNSSPTVTNCAFIHNGAFVGGGMVNYDSNPTVANCSFTANAGVLGGGMCNAPGTSPTITNCMFAGNSGISGGGMCNYNNSATITNCTFTANRSRGGGAMFNDDNANPTITSCIIWGNGQPQVWGTDKVLGTLSFSNIQGGLPAGLFDGGGNIAVDPMFVRDPDDGGDGFGDDLDTPDVDESLNDDLGDLRLQAGGPCINAGDPAYVPAPGETDLDGFPRILCGQVGMGAYEFGIGDYDCDQAVNLKDVAAMQTCFTGSIGVPFADGCEAFDYDANGLIDLTDLAGFALVLSR